VRALDAVDFRAARGEVHALMGENGAGKSTLMKVPGWRLRRKDAGEILLDGQPVDISSPAHAQALAIGIIHQELPWMHTSASARNIFLGREPTPQAPGVCWTRRNSTAMRTHCCNACTWRWPHKRWWATLRRWRASRWWRLPRHCPSSRGC